MEQLAETYAAEIGVLCVHRLNARPSILKAAENPFAVARGIATALVAAALDLPARSPSLTGHFTSIGGRARELGLTEATLLGDVGEVLGVADNYLSHTAPALLQTSGWIDLWLAVNETAVRSAMYGYTRRALSFHSKGDMDDSLPPIARFHREMFPPFADDSEGAVRAASDRLDLDSDAVIGTDSSGTILYWNDAAQTRYGHTRESILGRNVLDVTPTIYSRATAEVILRRAIEGIPWSGPFLVRNAEGTPVQVQRTDMPVQRHDRVVGVVGLRRFLAA